MKLFDKFPLARPGWFYLFFIITLAWISTTLKLNVVAFFLYLIAIWIVWFFRDPARAPKENDPRLVIAPADGKIIALDEVDCSALIGQRALLISIFMNIFDVHVNRSPLDGRVISVTRLSGSFMPANQPKAQKYNAQVAVLLETIEGQRILVSQVAGLIARRIECWVVPDEIIERGQRYGIIQFGSRVDLYLPPKTKTKVKLGMKVKAGETVIAELSQHAT